MILTFGLIFTLLHTQKNWPIEVGTSPKKDIGPIVRKADAYFFRITVR